MKIKIIKTPQGFAPEEIRKQWVGVTLPANPHANGYFVQIGTAIQALVQEGKTTEADFWLQYLLSEELVFQRSECELIKNDGTTPSFEEKFYFLWYGIPNESKQVIVFSGIPPRYKAHKKIERIPGKTRNWSSIDMFAESIQKGNQCHINFSPKKIAEIGNIVDIADNDQVQDFIAQWSKQFEGLNLMVHCKIMYSPWTKEKNRVVQKIVGTVQRL